MQDLSYNLFSNFQSTVLKAVKMFLSEKREDGSEKLIATSLRIPSDVKDFYDCIACADSTSLNTALLNTLTKVKDQTIRDYQKTHSTINDVFYYQVESLLKIIDAHKIDYNDLCVLLEWATDTKVSRSDITNKEKLVNLFDKTAQLKLCQTFGYSYDWLQDNNSIISYRKLSHDHVWYKNIQGFIKGLIHDFYLDDTVMSFELSFLCCDPNLVKNILSGFLPETRELITPIVIANRCIHGVKTRTYHRFQAEDINHEKCRKYLIALIKIVFMLKRNDMIKEPNGYILTTQQYDSVLLEKIPLVELFSTTHLSNGLNLEALYRAELCRSPSDDSTYTDKPHIYHALDLSILEKIVEFAGTRHTLEFTQELASKVNLSQKGLAKYLEAFDKDLKNNKNGLIVSFPRKEEDADFFLIHMSRVMEVRERIAELKISDDLLN